MKTTQGFIMYNRSGAGWKVSYVGGWPKQQEVFVLQWICTSILTFKVII